MTTKALLIPNIEQKIIGLLILILVSQALLYIYLVNSSIFNVVARKEQEEMISLTETEITGLVSEYMALSEKITLELAYERGFVDAPAKGVFAKVVPNTLTLSLLDNES
jgi:hypothetical protein